MQKLWMSAALGFLVASCAAQTVTVVETRGDRASLLARSEASFTAGSAVAGKGATVVVHADRLLQRMDGFGASMTGSSAVLLQSLSPADRSSAMHELFDPRGPLGLTLLREPIAASDFSAHGNYSYDDPASGSDESLQHFQLTHDGDEVLPLLSEALAINPQTRILLLPWSAPAWMKSNHSMNGGQLENRWIAAYAKYLTRTVEAYSQRGLPVYALNLQNEPENENPSYPTQLMSPAQEIGLAEQTRPLLRGAGFTALLIGYEHNWSNTEYPKQLLAHNGLFDGVSFHCYRGNETAQLDVLRAYPTASLWFTECSGTNGSSFAGDLMWQAHHLLLGAPLHGARSVLLWNLVLRPDGGPHNGGAMTVAPYSRWMFETESRSGRATSSSICWLRPRRSCIPTPTC
ncbi:hypothetical protein ACFQBQ_07805 [Granulicella cerasi]|uniref:Glycosyl hydrolase family 30 TIM-barrel domain-containing protein n=1 Tax=Granulicella cerasi TaxID=741063 RepID=A0ABW1Z7R9_9BACT